MTVDWAAYWQDISRAALVTIQFTLVGFSGAILFGLLLAIMRLTKHRVTRTVSKGYVELFKNIPLLTEIFVIYFGLASIGLVLSPFVAGSVALILFYGAYLSEIFRGAIEGVSPGQREAGLAVGLSPAHIYIAIILPQAARLALPATGNMLVDLLKATALMTTIAGAELMTVARNITSETFQALEVYLVITAVYFVLAYPLSRLVLRYEQNLKQGDQFSPRRRRTERRIAELAGRATG